VYINSTKFHGRATASSQTRWKETADDRTSCCDEILTKGWRRHGGLSEKYWEQWEIKNQYERNLLKLRGVGQPMGERRGEEAGACMGAKWALRINSFINSHHLASDIPALSLLYKSIISIVL
jgi:hypothetical protein